MLVYISRDHSFALGMRLITLVTVLALGALSAPATRLSKRAVEFYDPREGGGSQLNHSADAGEPLNVLSKPPMLPFVLLMCAKVIISGLSSPEVLTPTGFLNYARAIGL
jgi:hypothetical protein